ncbi:uncharacterized protein [Euphorbia lathyris]|uniref:uncharacterized protein n=1 Tax=Euphorbia lathyris TaxID=212925 RepID=UPI0033140315
MASISMAIYPSSFNYVSTPRHKTAIAATSLNLKLLFSSNLKGKRRVLEHVRNPLSAVGSGLEATITEPKDSGFTLKNVEVVVESSDEDKIQIRVDLPGKETEKVFGKILADLARTAPPVPGFRREKGGKTSKVPRDFLLQILGEERVTNFVIQEIVSTSIGDYAKKENLKVKDNKINTIQEAEQLKKLFTPGSPFGFNAVLELEKAETIAESSDSESESVSESES